VLILAILNRFFSVGGHDYRLALNSAFVGTQISG
jgi:hypothetical protein